MIPLFNLKTLSIPPFDLRKIPDSPIFGSPSLPVKNDTSLNFHCQRHFDDCLKISVLGRFDRNYELTWIGLELGEVENSEFSEFSEFSENSENQFSEVFHSVFSVLHYTQMENLELKTSEFFLRFTRTAFFLLNCVTKTRSK